MSILRGIDKLNVALPGSLFSALKKKGGLLHLEQRELVLSGRPILANGKCSILYPLYPLLLLIKTLQTCKSSRLASAGRISSRISDF